MIGGLSRWFRGERVDAPGSVDIVTFFYDDWLHGGAAGWREEYINRFANMVARNLSLPHRVILYTDDRQYRNDRLEVRYLPEYMDRWPRHESGIGMNLKRMIAWDPKQDLADAVMVIDLDMTIQNSIDRLITGYRGDFIMNEAGKGSPGGGIYYTPRRGLFGDRLWQPLHDDLPRALEISEGGRDRLWTDTQLNGRYDFLQRRFPGQVLSYRKNRDNPEALKRAAIVWYHGHPKPHELVEQGDTFIQSVWY